ncbi:hypothetical protein [Chryseobacterium sp. MP_3.2]|uniref:hypothetical protein n=1 Tax=Chryseobacterium sp. MP_3.2 TaxID=3071712 RepID=UPI002DFDBF17|nr:hypothetical protein [Chryseobacterium sp. MP_3.2]
MKKILLLAILMTVFSCKKESETIEGAAAKDSTRMTTLDSIQIPTFDNAEPIVAFSIVPQEVSSEKGRVIFTQKGQVIFYFDQNSSTGNINIDGQNYILDQTDFNENNYKLSGPDVKITATGGAFSDTTSECISGNFPDVKVTSKDKIVNLVNIEVKDCPAN